MPRHLIPHGASATPPILPLCVCFQHDTFHILCRIRDRLCLQLTGRTRYCTEWDHSDGLIQYSAGTVLFVDDQLCVAMVVAPASSASRWLTSNGSCGWSCNEPWGEGNRTDWPGTLTADVPVTIEKKLNSPWCHARFSSRCCQWERTRVCRVIAIEIASCHCRR